MSPRQSLPPLSSPRTAGALRHARAVVLEVIGLAVLAGVVHVVDVALQVPAVGMTVAVDSAAPPPRTDRDDAEATPVSDLLPVPPASADAIAL